MLTKGKYEMDITFLYQELCNTNSLQKENEIRKKIKKLEDEWSNQIKCMDYLENHAKHVKRFKETPKRQGVKKKGKKKNG